MGPGSQPNPATRGGLRRTKQASPLNWAVHIGVSLGLMACMTTNDAPILALGREYQLRCEPVRTELLGEEISALDVVGGSDGHPMSARVFEGIPPDEAIAVRLQRELCREGDVWQWAIESSLKDTPREDEIGAIVALTYGPEAAPSSPGPPGSQVP